MGLVDVAEDLWAEAVKAHNEAIDNKISELKSEINKLQNLHDSLLEFKGKCEFYYDNFNSISASKKKKLSDLRVEVHSSDVKDTYVKSMNKTFYQMARKRMEQDLWIPYGILIDDKLQEYKDKVEKLEEKIRDLQNDYW